MGNMDIWDKLRQPPKDALKPISGGRMNGKTDINPTWRLEAMTDTFGPCGIGWKYTIDRLWTEPGTSGQVFAFALVSVCIKEGEAWSAPVPGIGGNMLIEQESRGLHDNDEGFKMAVTDALSVALKALGVAADIYRGRWDGSKYKDAPLAVPSAPPPKPDAPELPKIKELCAELKLSDEEKRTLMVDFTTKSGTDYKAILHKLQDMKLDAVPLTPALRVAEMFDGMEEAFQNG